MRRLDPRAHPGVWSAAVVAVVLVVANRWVLSDPFWEHSDYAADSILIERATRLRLTTGQYSRFGWFHPGPAALYAQAAGELVAHRWTRLAASPYGGQLLGMVAANAVLMGLVVRTVARWHRSAWTALAVLAVVLGYGAASTGVLTNGWAPFTWAPQLLLLLVASASVLGRDDGGRDLWLVVLATGLLVHGHLGFVVAAGPLGAVVVAVALRRLVLAHDDVATRRALARAGVVLAVLALPMVAHVLGSWPGELGGWWRQLRDGSGGTQGPGEAARFVASFFLRDLGPGRGPLVVALVAAAVACAAWDGDHERRRATRALLGVAAGATLSGWLYAWQGIDDLSLEYLGVYLIAVPWVLVVVVAARLADEAARLRLPWAPLVGVAGVVAFGVVVVAAPGWRDHYRGQPEVGPAVVALGAAGALPQGGALVIELEPVAWVDALGLLVAVHRDGHRACLADPTWAYMVTDDFVCDEGDRTEGLVVRVAPGGADDPAAVWSGSAFTVRRVDPGPPDGDG